MWTLFFGENTLPLISYSFSIPLHAVVQTGSHSYGCAVSRSTYSGMLYLERERKSSKSKLCVHIILFTTFIVYFILQGSTSLFVLECL